MATIKKLNFSVSKDGLFSLDHPQHYDAATLIEEGTRAIITDNGTLKDSESYATSKEFAVSANDYVVFRDVPQPSNTPNNYALYDNSGNVLEIDKMVAQSSNKTFAFFVPNGATKLRVCLYSSASATLDIEQDSIKHRRVYDKSLIQQKGYLKDDGSVQTSASQGVTPFVPILSAKKVDASLISSSLTPQAIVFYNSSKGVVSSIKFTKNNELEHIQCDVPSDTAYVRFTNLANSDCKIIIE